VLAETSALALEHIAEGFERAITCSRYSAAMTPIVKQRVDRFLQHSLLVADNDFWCFELKQVTQPVIPVDDAAIKIVQVRSREAPAFQRHQRTKVRRNHRQHRQ